MVINYDKNSNSLKNISLMYAYSSFLENYDPHKILRSHTVIIKLEHNKCWDMKVVPNGL